MRYKFFFLLVFVFCVFVPLERASAACTGTGTAKTCVVGDPMPSISWTITGGPTECILTNGYPVGTDGIRGAWAGSTTTATGTNNFYSSGTIKRIIAAPAGSYAFTCSIGSTISSLVTLTVTAAPTTGVCGAPISTDLYPCSTGIKGGGTTTTGVGSWTCTGTDAVATACTSYLIDTTVTGSGTISPVDPSVLSGGSQVFTITPDASNAISDVLVNGMSAGAVASYTSDDVRATRTIAVTFGTTNNCANSKDSSGNALTVLKPSTASEPNGGKAVAGGLYKAPVSLGNYCFKNNSLNTFFVPVNTNAEFQSFWINRPASIIVIP